MTLLMMRGKGCFGIVPLLMLILSGLAALTSCGARQGASPFDASGFHSDKYRVILYFDLRDDGQPGAGVVVNENTLQGAELRSLVLPFGSKSVRPSRALFSTSGSYEDVTVINYVLTPGSAGPKEIGIVPVFDAQPEGTYSLEDLDGSLYFLRLGLERRFIYKYPDKRRSLPEWPADVQNTFVRTPDAIAVALPPSADPRVIRSGQTEMPSRIGENRLAAFYPYSGTQANALELRYVIPANSGQKLVLEYGVKVLAAILTPLLGLLLLGPAENMRPRTRNLVLVVGTVLEVAILIAIWRVAVVVSGEGALKTGLDLSVVLAGAVFSGLVLWVKRKK
jgi:hypothetical protein